MITIDENGESVSDITINIPAHINMTGATGLASCDEYIYMVAQSKFSQLIILDKALKLVKIESLEPLKGVHSIIHQDDFLYMVVTKQDKVVKYHLKDSKIETVFDLHTQKDIHHLNSICFHQNQLLGSGFGDHDKEFWMHAENGYVYDVLNNKKIMTGLKQPHSLFSFDDQLFVCDSSRKRVVNQDKKVVYQSNSGYIRGLYINENIKLIGRSKGRVVSQSQGRFVGNIADKGILTGACGITVLKGNDYQKTIDLSGFADEIYDIYPVHISK